MISIHFEEQKKSYKPGELLSGRVEWSFSEPSAEIEIHLLWHSEGKGTQDAEVVNTVSSGAVDNSGQHSFEFVLPESPYSYHGTLMSIVWQVEAVAANSNEITREDFYLSPSGRPITPASKAESPSIGASI